mgnify:CR=1 FL=1
MRITVVGTGYVGLVVGACLAETGNDVHCADVDVAKIEGLKGAINDMRMKQAMAEIHEMSAGMVANLGGGGDTLNRLTEMVEEERNKAAGRARVARDALNLNEVNIKEAEMNALADQALADFAAREEDEGHEERCSSTA